jgi:hypothetical protein
MISEADQRSLSAAQDLEFDPSKAGSNGRKSVLLTVYRDGKRRFVWLDVAP